MLTSDFELLTMNSLIIARAGISRGRIARFVSPCAHPLVQAFSLLELVIVVAILGILTSVSLPALLGNTERAKIVAAKVAIQNAISECVVARNNGYSQLDLTFKDAGGSLTADVVPSLFSKPQGYYFDESLGGCHAMYLLPDVGSGAGDAGTGFPILQAKIAGGGRVIKAFRFCQKTSSVDLESECLSWDSQSFTVERENCNRLGSARAREKCHERNKLNAGAISSNRIDLDNPDGSWLLRQE